MKRSSGRSAARPPWNLGKLVGQKTPLKLKEIWSIRVRLQLKGDTRQLALFDLAIDSKLRACDLVGLRVRDVTHGMHIGSRGASCSARQSAPSSSRSRRRLEMPLPHGSIVRSSDSTTTSFPADSEAARSSLRASTSVW